MPSGVVKSIAKTTGKTVAEVEKIWDESKAEAAKKFPKKDGHYWAYVTTVVKRKCGISEDIKFSFKNYLEILSE